ncbi:hypothetical protein PISMIDRAFT_12036 [Pisolithus microcarpus 441]|uniref:Uncharacterized protein n=1 Tax=Pisolithus microcarpus 441 TaxID=765257 RepID=A0A0C9ZGW2_9AGAM|nr:hypothetical protein PISMIDRAFT_12036 [Pisolithus microcarpus 441]
MNMEVDLLEEMKMEAVLLSETIMEETSLVKEEDHLAVMILKRRTKMVLEDMRELP